MPNLRLLSLITLLTLAPPLVAQTGTPPSRLSFGARAGAALPVGDFADAAGTGFHAGVEAGYAVLPPLSVYAGYRYTNYPLDGLADLEEITLQGPVVGLALDGPRPSPWINTRVHVGVTLLDVNVRGASDLAMDRTASIVGGVSAGTRLGGGVGLAGYIDGDICPPWWPWGPRGPFGPGGPKRESAVKFGLTASLQL